MMFRHVSPCFWTTSKISLEKRLGKTREVRTGPNAGDLTYQAEIFVPQGSRDAVNHSGRPRGSLWQTDRLGRPRQRKTIAEMLIFRFLLMFFFAYETENKWTQIWWKNSKRWSNVMASSWLASTWFRYIYVYMSHMNEISRTYTF